MIRPWMGVAGVVLGLVLSPGVAAAQDPPADTTGPVITIGLTDGASFTQNQAVAVTYGCTDPESQVTDCVGPVASGGALDTSTVGPHNFSVTSHNSAGLVSTKSVNYSVVVSDPGPIGGETPATLTLTLGTPSPFAPFIPGVGQTYTTSLVATVTSTAADATLSVIDPATTNAGHLVNGAYTLPSALQAGAARGGTFPATTAAIGGSDAPTTLLTYDGPVTNDPVTLGFKQQIGVTDTLRTGSYAKTFTFTLSTTNP